MTPLFELHTIKEKKKNPQEKQENQTTEKIQDNIPCQKNFFLKKKMQPEANDANRKTVSGPALRADGSLLDFSISWSLHKQGAAGWGQPAL